MTFTAKYVVKVQSTTILQDAKGQQQFEMLVMECEVYPEFLTGVCKIVGRLIGGQGTDAKLSTFHLPYQNFKWCSVESKGSADIVIPHPVLQVSR